MPIKYMNLTEFRDLGYLQELNRNFLHTLGLGMEMTTDKAGRTVISGIWDYRDDPEGLCFNDLSDEGAKIKSERIHDQLEEKMRYRVPKLGWFVQPIGHKFENKAEEK